MKRLLRLIAPAIGVVGIVIAGANPALAHESRIVGPYKFTVGWKVEPSFSDADNAVQIFVRNAADNSPVTSGVVDNVKVEVLFGTKKTDAMPLKTVFGSPGEYNAALLPTRPGTYTFHFMGAIAGQAVDQSFTSSPTTFNNVEDAKTIQFPANDPTRGEIAQRQDRTDTRVQSQITSLQSDLRQTRDSAQTDLILAIIGIAVGVIGLGALGIVAWMEARRRRRPEQGRAAPELASSET